VPALLREIPRPAGCTDGLFAGITALFRAGDRVLCFDPRSGSYAPAVALSGGVLQRIALTPPHFRVDWQPTSALLSVRTRLGSRNTPHNPTATVWRQAYIVALWHAPRQRESYVFTVEVDDNTCFAP
ncbi:aminotransferase class I/II-fold pyridoxal phosphate-dependent enzyme, partial [Salmonella enterica]|uniref:aminotransferase class I/II-fold pyridoxal phosphate-dependent enzyme n=1 Tax=Salmonella enterica TaxID=28901 RepID=UPI00398C4B2A